jgi:hypothetical protein
MCLARMLGPVTSEVFVIRVLTVGAVTAAPAMSSSLLVSAGRLSLRIAAAELVAGGTAPPAWCARKS